MSVFSSCNPPVRVHAAPVDNIQNMRKSIEKSAKFVNFILLLRITGSKQNYIYLYPVIVIAEKYSPSFFTCFCVPTKTNGQSDRGVYSSLDILTNPHILNPVFVPLNFQCPFLFSRLKTYFQTTVNS